MRIIPFPKRSDWPKLLARPVQDATKIEKIVAPILKKVKEKASISFVLIAILAKIEFEAKNSKTIKTNPISFKSKLKLFIVHL